MTRTQTRWFAAAAATVAAFSLVTAPVVTAEPTAPVEAAIKAPAWSWSKFTTASTRAKTPTAVPQAATAADFTSIFAAQVPALTNSGWATCPAAITWSVDTRGLSDDEAAAQIANLQWAFDQWGIASGLAFQFAGTANLVYDDAGFTLTPADGSASPSRNVFLDFVPDSESARLGGGVVGLASPSTVWQSSKEIESGTVVFRTDYVKSAGAKEAKALYLHELGHVLGLGHANESDNRMFAIVKDGTELGAGDVAGVRTMLKPCTTGA